VFKTWPYLIPDDIGLYAIQLPGHGRRLAEPPLDELGSIVKQLGAVLTEFSDLPLVFFGHSMGALMAFETARELRRIARIQPELLFVAGYHAPQVGHRPRSIHDLPEAEFIQKIRDLEGTPAEILDDSQALGIILPPLRADFKIVDTYRYQLDLPLRCPITAFSGANDSHFEQGAIDAWRFQTTGAFSMHILAGGHFFIHESECELLELIVADLSQILTGSLGAKESL